MSSEAIRVRHIFNDTRHPGVIAYFGDVNGVMRLKEVNVSNIGKYLEPLMGVDIFTVEINADPSHFVDYPRFYMLAKEARRQVRLGEAMARMRLVNARIKELAEEHAKVVDSLLELTK